MALLRLDQAQLAYGDNPLLDHVDLAIEPKQRIGLVGRNGMGKSTLMRVLAGNEPLDGGVFNAQNDVRVVYLEQELPEANELTVFEFLVQGLDTLGKLLSQYDKLTQSELDEKGLNELDKVGAEIDRLSGWDIQQKILGALGDLKLEPQKRMADLSGGWRKRCAIVRALLNQPDVLLLDEPTNHLDIPAIEWLQKQILNQNCAIVLITHDRRFLEQIADQIWWLDRGRVVRFEGTYSKYLEGKEEFLANEERQNALFDKRLAEEEKWIRQGIKARRTRNEGRVRALKSLRNERKARIDVKGNVNMQIDAGERSGKRVVELTDVAVGYGDTPVLKNINLNIQRGDRIGFIGKNGAGKSTLIKLILGQLSPISGEIVTGSKQQVAYFDQLRSQLDESQSVFDNLSEGRDFITVNGKDKHVMSYLSDFLFTPARVRSPVSTLSGGEKNRLLLAKLFSQQANILVLDEPTNDLDIETLELLEELLCDYQGTVLLASHDREFVDQIVSSTVYIDDAGDVYNYVGGFDDLARQHGKLWQVSEKADVLGDAVSDVASSPDSPASTVASPEPKKARKKLSYKLQRELDELPENIAELEDEIAAIESKMAEPDFFNQEHSVTSKTTDDLAEKQETLENFYARWDELENMT